MVQDFYQLGRYNAGFKNPYKGLKQIQDGLKADEKNSKNQQPERYGEARVPFETGLLKISFVDDSVLSISR